MAWIIDNGYPYQDTLGELIEIPTEPYPCSIMTQEENEYPKYNHLNLLDVGAFTNATNLRYVRIPESVKKIGEYAFRNTALTSVTIARDCVYYPTSFPDGCVINFYGGNSNSFKTADGLTFWTRDNLKFGVKE